MSTLLGLDNTFAHDLIKQYGQPMVLVDSGSSTLNEVTGIVTPGVAVNTPVYGYAYPASVQYATAYGIANVQQDDELVFLEAVKEPTNAMKLSMTGGDSSVSVFNIDQVKKLTNAGFAVLFVVLIRK